MGAITQLLGQWGVLAIVGFIAFMIAYKNSLTLFQWVEQQTYGNRDYVMDKLELLHMRINEQHVTYVLIFLSFGLAVIVFALFAFWGKLVPAIIFSALIWWLGWKIPKPLLNSLVEKRISKYQAQMTDGLNLLANGLRAGLSLPQSIGMVVDELPNPIAQEFNLILQQNKIGSPLDECFNDLVRRIPTQDNEMFVTSVNILRETGGNLAETFDTIIDVIRERIRLQQKIDTYVAQGMMQGGTIFCMPFAMGAYNYFSDPESMIKLFTTPVGIVIALSALALNLTGGAVILKIVKIRV